jgi:hypothetical protein
VRRPRFHLRTLMVAVGIIAALLVDLRVNLSWWAVKPALYLVFIPLVSASLAARIPHRGLVVLVGAINALLLLAWYELRRPTEGILVGGSDTEYVLHLMQDCCYSEPNLGIRRAFGWVVGWVVWRGTMPDLLCLIGSMLVLMAMLARSVSLRSRIIGAMSLTVLSIYGWATSRRWGGTDDSQDWLTFRPWYGGDKTPVHLAQRWLHEGGGLPTIWSAIGAVRALELAVLAIVFVSLTAVAWHASVNGGRTFHSRSKRKA